MPQKSEVNVEATIPIKEIQEFEKVWKDLVKSLKDSFKSISDIDREMKRLQGTLKAVSTSSAKLTDEQKEEVKQLKLTVAALAAVKGEYKTQDAVIQQQIELHRQLRESAKKQGEEQKKAAEKAAAAQKKAAQEAERAANRNRKAISKVIKAIGRWAFASATLFFLYRKIRRAVGDLVQDMIRNTDEAKRLEQANLNLRASFFAAYGEEVLAAVNAVAGAVNSIASFTEGMAQQESLREQLFGIAEAQRQAGELSEEAARMMVTSLGAFNKAKPSEMAALYREFAMALGLTAEQYDEVIAKSEELTEKAKAEFLIRQTQISQQNKIKSATASLIQIAARHDEALAKNAQSLRELRAEYEATTRVIRAQFMGAMTEIDMGLSEQIADINARAAKARESAFADFNRAIARAQQTANKAIRDNQRRHQLQMEFAQKRHDLTMLQNQRVFEYERELLVAEGDVLAIEDLDARHQLEQQAAEENFQLQMQQAEAMFRLQAQILASAIRDQIGELRAGLAERLAEIEEGRREEIAEAEENAEEMREQARQAAQDALADALVAKLAEEQLNKEAHKKILDDTAKALVALGIETKEGADAILSAWESVMGSDEALEQMFNTAYTNIQNRTAAFASNLRAQINEINLMLATTIQGLGSIRGGGGIRRRSPLRPVVGYQFGGDFIASRPQLIEVGHGPERVTVQPLSAIGMLTGSVTHRWGGGAIPVQGQGSMSGVDMSAFGNQVAQKTVSQMRAKLRDTRGQRGN